MIWISRSTLACFRPICALVSLLVVTGCANTGSIGSTGVGLSAPNAAIPEYVRNLPKSRTGNMAEYTVFGKQYRVMDSAADFTEQGIASWYGKKFHGRKTSSGEVYDMHGMTAAHKHLPLPTYVRATNLENDRSVVVKVNDRGPFVGDRIIDMSYAAAIELGMTKQGTANILIEALSTHVVAENESASNAPGDEVLDQAIVDIKAAVPEAIEPELAAVPLQKPAAVISEFENNVPPLGEDAPAVVAGGGNEDGFVELPATADTSLAKSPSVEQPTDVQPLASAEVPLTGKASAQASGTYYIQLGAFGHRPNAEALVTEVAEQTGMPTFVVKDEAKSLFKVKMGPFEKGAVLDNAMTELASIGIDGYTRRVVKR